MLYKVLVLIYYLPVTWLPSDTTDPSSVIVSPMICVEARAEEAIEYCIDDVTESRTSGAEWDSGSS